MFKNWLRKKLKNWLHEEPVKVVPVKKEDFIEIRSSVRWKISDIQEMNAGGLSNKEIIRSIKNTLTESIKLQIEEKELIQFFQYEDPTGVSIDNRGITFEAKIKIANGGE